MSDLEQVACECQAENQPDQSLDKEKQCEKLIDERGKCVTKKLKGKEAQGCWPNARFPAPPDMVNPKTGNPVTRLVPDVVLTAAGSFPANTISVGKRRRAKKAGFTPGPVQQVADFKFPCPPSTKKPFPPASGDGKGYGKISPPGAKELGAYKNLTDPPKKVKVITPSEALCG